MILTYLDHDHGIWAPRPWPEHWPHSPRWRHLPRWLRWPRLPRCTHPSFASAGPGLLSKVPHIERASEHWNGRLQRRKHKPQSNWSQQNHTIQREVGVKTFCSTKMSDSPISIHLYPSLRYLSCYEISHQATQSPSQTLNEVVLSHGRHTWPIGPSQFQLLIPSRNQALLGDKTW